jgi:hypothetical protein
VTAFTIVVVNRGRKIWVMRRFSSLRATVPSYAWGQILVATGKAPPSQFEVKHLSPERVPSSWEVVRASRLGLAGL